MRVKLLKLPEALQGRQDRHVSQLLGFRDVHLQVVTQPPGSIQEAGSADKKLTMKMPGH